MKKRFLFWALLLLLACPLHSNAQSIEPQVNENVELMSILSRLAGFSEYRMDIDFFHENLAGEYTGDINKYFEKQSKHLAVKYMKMLRLINNIGYDAIMSMALHLQNRDGKLYYVDSELKELDSRWDRVNKKRFLSLLNKFYQDSDFDVFFKEHQKFYAKGLNACRENMIKYFDQAWYSNFYGKQSQERYSVIIGFNNGAGNYGPCRQIKGENKEVFAILGYCENKEGIPLYDKSDLSTLIHEFNHSFINYLLDEKQFPDHVKDLEHPASVLYESCKSEMEQQAYGDWKTLINESLVRAAVICYMMDNENFSTEEVEEATSEQIESGFRWMPELVSLLREYEGQRNEYPDFESFYPRVINFFTEYVENVTE